MLRLVDVMRNEGFRRCLIHLWLLAIRTSGIHPVGPSKLRAASGVADIAGLVEVFPDLLLFFERPNTLFYVGLSWQLPASVACRCVCL